MKRSRVATTRQLAAAINACPAEQRPKVLVNSSAVGYYGSSEVSGGCRAGAEWNKCHAGSLGVAWLLLSGACVDGQRKTAMVAGHLHMCYAVLPSAAHRWMGHCCAHLRCRVAHSRPAFRPWLTRPAPAEHDVQREQRAGPRLPGRGLP